MVSNASERTIITPADDRILDRWQAFFKVSEKFPADKKSLYAMGKLTQVALVNYMKLRGVYSDDLFVKRHYEGFTFFTLNTTKEEGVKLNEIVRSAGSFINITALKALRFQLLHDPEKPHEIGEELYFLFYYGNKPRVELDFGMDDKLELDMSDCSFETFLNCFGSIIGKINAYCAHLNPLPTCEKRFRTSFCKTIPLGVATGPFKPVSGRVEYAPDILAKDVGTVVLSGIAAAAILRTCYSTDEIDNAINENVETMVQSEVNDIMGRGVNGDFLEVPRRGQGSDELPYQNTIEDRSIAGSIIEQNQTPPEVPVQDVLDVPVRDEVAPVIDEQPPQTEVLTTSLPHDESLVSFEVVMSPFPRQILIHDQTLEMEASRSDSDVEPEENAAKKAKNLKKADSSEEDSMMRERKDPSSKRKPSNKEGIDEISKSRPKRPRRNV